MKTILYLQNSYIASLSELRVAITKILKKKENVKQTEDSFEEVETLFKDGIFFRWLDEGDSECAGIADKLRGISENIDSSELKREIGRIFSDEEVVVNRNFSDFVEITRISFAPFGGENITVKDCLEYAVEKPVTAVMMFKFQIKKQAKECFRLQFQFGNELIDEEKTIDLRSYQEGESVTIEFKGIEINTTVKEEYFRLLVDGKTVRELKYFGSSDKIFRVKGVKFKMKKVAGGNFYMGSTELHKVTINDYYIGETLVTQELWEAVMDQNPSAFKGNLYPVGSVSYYDCLEFVEKLNGLTKQQFRLPTEAEWEYAARGGKKGKGYKWAGCDNEGKLKDYVWYISNSNHRFHQVKLKKPNELDIYDMSGNLLEWCYDYYSDYGTSPLNNPRGPSYGTYRVLRGGCFGRSADDCRVDYRVASVPFSRGTDIGLRLALDCH